jgi:hypothetical protein
MDRRPARVIPPCGKLSHDDRPTCGYIPVILAARHPCLRAIFLLAVVAAAGGCYGSGAEPDACPRDLPAACPAQVPSYATDVAPVIETHCVTCHGPNGPASMLDFRTYDKVFAKRTSILSQVYSCRMPPHGSPAPTPQERATLLDWLVCNAPDN